jgi:glycine/D-amino acid oxidase-like deaminating enzyme
MVTKLQPSGPRWRVETDRGASVDAGRVLLATNGYTGDLAPVPRRTMIAVNSLQIVTESLACDLRATILPNGCVASDTRQMLPYFRPDEQGRLLMGGLGPFGAPTRRAAGAHLERALSRLFPTLKGARIAYRWSGRGRSDPRLPAPSACARSRCPRRYRLHGPGHWLQTSLGKALAGYGIGAS